MSGRNFLTPEQTHQLLTDVLRGDVQIVRAGDLPEHGRKGWVSPIPDGSGWTASWFEGSAQWVYGIFPEDGADNGPQVWRKPYEIGPVRFTRSLSGVVDEIARAAGIQPGNETQQRDNENFSRIMSGLHEIAESVGADKPGKA